MANETASTGVAELDRALDGLRVAAGPSGWSRPVRLAPGERRVAGRVQVAAAVAAEPERRQQSLALAKQFPGDQRPDADHLVPVIGVGDDVGVLVEGVEDGEA